MSCLSIPLIPSAVLYTTGKKHPKNMAVIIVLSPMPNVISNTGTHAIVGMAMRKLIIGERARSIALILPISIPSETPRSAPIPKPISNRQRLLYRCIRIIGSGVSRLYSVWAIIDGEGRTVDLAIPVSTIISHNTTTSIMGSKKEPHCLSLLPVSAMLCLCCLYHSPSGNGLFFHPANE